MSIKRFHAPTMTQGLRLVAAELGDEAVILSNRRVEGGVEILAALDMPQAESEQADHQSEPVSEPSDHKALSHWLDSLKVKRQAEPTVAQPDVAEPAPVNTASQEANNQELAAVRAELEALKSMLSQPKPSPVSRPAPSEGEPELSGLQALGFSSEFVKKVTPTESVSQAIAQIAAMMTPNRTQAIERGRVLLTGATGAGKTTTLAKIATQHVIEHGADKVAIISADHFRIGAQESLRTIAKILGVSFASATPEQPLGRWLKEFKHKQLVLIDTSGCKDGMRFIREQLADVHQPVQQILTVPASHQPSVLTHQYQQSAKLIGEADAVVMTKLDENPQVGAVLEWLMSQRLMVNAWCDGSNIPDDLHWGRIQDMLLKAKQKIDRRSGHRAA